MQKQEITLTVDDLIMEYMICKVENNYNPNFSITEFLDFLHYFEKQKTVTDTLDDGEKLFNRFLERKTSSAWMSINNTVAPHIEMTYDNKIKDYLIKANYNLSLHDREILNTSKMDNGMSKYEDYKGEAYNIRNIITKYLNNQPKRTLDDKVQPSNIDTQFIDFGKYLASRIILNIWNSYIDLGIQENTWPIQCYDIEKYLLNLDLAKVIEKKSIKNQVLDFYNLFPTRLLALYNEDNNLKVATQSSAYLPVSNYNLLVKNFEDIVKYAYGKNKKSLYINAKDLVFVENYNNTYIYGNYGTNNMTTTTQKEENEEIKKLVLQLDKQTQNKKF